MNVSLLFKPGRSLALFSLLATILTGASGCGFSYDDDDNIPTILPAVAVGSLVITEILANPNVGRPEFVEIQNSSDSIVSLQGCEVADGGSSAHQFILNAPTLLEPDQYAILSGGEYLGAAEGELVPDALWDGIVLNQGDETESFSISCPDGVGGLQLVDTVAFDWGSIGVARGRSWQLAIEADATANDDPGNWCPAPAQDDVVYALVDGIPDYGSPGLATTCETPGGATPSNPGDVVITEILIHDISGSIKEWFELHNPGANAVDIRGCVLIDEALGDGSDPNNHTVNYENGETVIEAGGYLLLSKTTAEITSDGSLIADYPYGQLSFTNSELQRLAIDCPAGDSLSRIDEVVYDWSDRSGHYRGYSLSLSSASLNAEANDDPDNWCVGEDIYFNATTEDEPTVSVTGYGSPGAANPSCPSPGPFPLVGELIITELLIDDFPGVREWVEVYNPTLGELDLFGCEMVDVPVAQASDPDAADRHRITPQDGTTTVPAGGYLVLSKSALDVTPDGSIVADYAYDNGITLNNSDPQYISVDCPDSVGTMTEIDRVEYNWGDYGSDYKGASLSLSRDAISAVDNDSATSWCLAQSTELYYSATTSDTPPVEYRATGTPGSVNSPCP
ncbi:MAG: hypothetical protein CMP23_01195 [Rickettsiales bacterium]|nr:hypothetical protein [Rickettsiales bacterium]|tara:strand:- start:1318 stop:3183 length:1866 start_codon:yes stop_codon:yes gene_type:complete